jgi:UDP-N-acetylglucosamine 4,6-dehydratase
MLNDATILVTGGTGSFGRAFVRMTLERYNPRKLIVFSRDEMKQEDMQREFGDHPALRFFLGDVRDKDRLKRACQGVDYLVHAAALKIVPTAEYNPFECIKTNVLGAMNVIDSAIDTGIKRVVALSTDKACNPVNLYGATKLCSDKLFIAGGSYVGDAETRFSVVRYGNVMGSRGSVIPFFQKLATAGREIPITHPDMTRFMISLDQGVELVYTALHEAVGGEIFVKKIPSMRVLDIAEAIAPELPTKIIGMRPGEKLHEQMISVEDSPHTYEFSDYYKIIPSWSMPKRGNTVIVECDSQHPAVATPVGAGFSYSSDANDWWLAPADLRQMLEAAHARGSASDIRSTDYAPIA